MECTIPLGAQYAAERAYAELTDDQRTSPQAVAEALLQAAAPFMAPLASQLGRRKLSSVVIKSIVGSYLRGTSVAQLASEHSVTPQTVRAHIRRQMALQDQRVKAGVPLSRIAREFRCPEATLMAAIERALKS